MTATLPGSASRPVDTTTPGATAATPSNTAPPAQPMARAGGGYSRFVGLMRITLPLAAVAIIILVITWPELGEKRTGFKLGMSEITVNDSGGQTIVNPRFTGTDRARRPFTVTADAATQNQKTPDQINLAFPKADLTLEDGIWIAISAANGVYDRNAEALTLTGGVDLFHDRGYELHTKTARITLGEGEAAGDGSVQGQGPFGTLQAGGFRMRNRGTHLLLIGKSRLVLYPVAKGK